MIALEPNDAHTRTLLDRVHPADWTNPTPDGRYHLVVVGAGTAGLVTAMGAAGLGAKVALVERHLMGGDCLNFGCVPSKALLRTAKAVGEVWGAGELGVRVGTPEVDFPAVMERMRRLRTEISVHDSAARFAEAGIDVYLGEGRFTGPRTLEVEGTTLEFKKAVVATGGRASLPPIDGLAEADPLTNETIFGLTERPRRLIVIGAGPIGCELAQAFRRFGAEVNLVEALPRVLSVEDPEAAAVVERALVADGITLHTSAVIERVSREGGVRRVHLKGGRVLEGEALLVAAGRRPNVEGLGLEAAGVEYDKRGVVVDDRLRTTNRRIFAAGDVAFRYKFTHAAEFTARIVIQNALFFGRAKASALTIPWCTYTDPEIAHVGLTLADARERGLELDTWVVPLSEVDRAVLDGETEGFVKALTEKGKPRLLGATVVARHAGDLLGELCLAVTQGIGLDTLVSVIHPYPTQADAIRRLGGQWQRGRLTPRVKAVFDRWFAWTR